MKFGNEEVDAFKRDGYFVIPDYFTFDECNEIQAECKRLVDEMNPDEHNTLFSTDRHENTGEDYFMTSGDKIRFFWEPVAKDENGKLLYPKMMGLNKIGHAFHELNPVFKKHTFTEKFRQICKSFEFKKPCIPQSMYIFKNQKIGGEVTKHIDESFLETSPTDYLMGVWIALEDTTLDNGCLWFAPGSHIGAKVTFHMRRNPNKNPEEKPIILTGKLDQIPDDKFVAMPMKKGSAVLIHGMVQHRSHKNMSDKPRPAYTFHMYESHECTWSPENWLQPTKNMPFTDVYSQYQN